MSEQHKEYLISLKKYHRKIKFFRFLVFAIFLILWETAANLNWIDAFFFSSPSRIVGSVFSMGKTGELFTHIGYTLAFPWEKQGNFLHISDIPLRKLC